MTDYNNLLNNLIKQNEKLNGLDPFTRLMKYRMLSNKEMMDIDRCKLVRRVYEKLGWTGKGLERLESDTFFGSAYNYTKKMCMKYDLEKNDNFYIEDFKRFVVSEKKENYDTMKINRAQYLRKEWFCLESTKDRYRKILKNEDVLYYIDSSHKIGSFLLIPRGFGFVPKCKWLLDDGIRALLVMEDNWRYIKRFYGNISFEDYKTKFCLEAAYCNGKLNKDLMIDFNLTWGEIFEILRKLAELIDQRTDRIIAKQEE